MEDYPDLKSLHILHYPDPLLREQSQTIREINSFLDEMVARMAELMQDEKGVGLAAPQVGWRFRMVVANPTMEPRKVEALINPVIVKRWGNVVGDEGCLSVPGIFAKVKRAERILIRGTRLDNSAVEFEAEGFPARLWQHELDHLEGSLFVDRIGPTSKILIRNSLRELEQQYADGTSAETDEES